MSAFSVIAATVAAVPLPFATMPAANGAAGFYGGVVG